MESVIDEYYRLLLFSFYLYNVKEITCDGSMNKFIFTCPFCGVNGMTPSKKTQKGALLWNKIQNSWVFSCVKKGSPECSKSKSMYNLIRCINNDLGEAYREVRWHSGTTGKGHNCSSPEFAKAINKLKQTNEFPAKIKNIFEDVPSKSKDNT